MTTIWNRFLITLLPLKCLDHDHLMQIECQCVVQHVPYFYRNWMLLPVFKSDFMKSNQFLWIATKMLFDSLFFLAHLRYVYLVFVQNISDIIQDYYRCKGIFMIVIVVKIALVDLWLSYLHKVNILINSFGIIQWTICWTNFELNSNTFISILSKNMFDGFYPMNQSSMLFELNLKWKNEREIHVFCAMCQIIQLARKVVELNVTVNTGGCWHV